MPPTHYSKVYVELPDSPADPPYATVKIECDICGEEILRTHVAHLGTLLRVLTLTTADISGDGESKVMSGVLPGDEATKQRAREHLDKHFPQWKGDQIRHKRT